MRKESGDVGRTSTVVIAGERTKGSKTKEVSTARAKVDEGEPVPILVYPMPDHVSLLNEAVSFTFTGRTTPTCWP